MKGMTMYFCISKRQKQFFAQTFDNATPWETVTSKIEGNVVVELFQNDKLEKQNFEEYFKENYNKDAGKTR
jgi:hypothetical protein